MNEKTLEVLTALANKMDTTAEHLWGVLVRQAPITGVIDLALMAAWVVAAWLWYRVVLRKTMAAPKTTYDDDFRPRADWREEIAFAAWVSVGLLIIITAVLVNNKFTITITALVNPEYWALRQILQ